MVVGWGGVAWLLILPNKNKSMALWRGKNRIEHCLHAESVLNA